jgi:hypothetical protein
MMCSASRYLLLAWITGMIVATVTSSDLLGLVAAALAAATAYGLARLNPARFGGGSCPLPQPVADDTTQRTGR